MRNSYYIITLPANKSLARVEEFLTKSIANGKTYQALHYRLNKDKTKAIIQGEITSEVEALIVGKAASYVEYIGDFDNNKGQVVAQVYDYIRLHSDEWVWSDI